MNYGFLQMSTPPSGPPPGYGAPPSGYAMPPAPQQNNTAKIVLIVLAVVFGGGIFLIAILAAILFPVFQKVRGNARLASCEVNVQQIDIGLMQYAQDHNGKFPPPAAYKNAVFPYVKSESIFHCPADKDGPVDYSMNANLQGGSLDKIVHPEEVVTIYEGHNQTLDFRHDGKAVVGFADGHDRAVTQAQAQHLQWKP
jgi:prepilin-type processing-associated H-X9-DG protein